MQSCIEPFDVADVHYIPAMAESHSMRFSTLRLLMLGQTHGKSLSSVADQLTGHDLLLVLQILADQEGNPSKQPVMERA